nr:hypothetical protein [Tanacetum cinerariifolium]
MRNFLLLSTSNPNFLIFSLPTSAIGDDDHWLESGNQFFDKWTSTRLMLIEEKQVTIRAIKSSMKGSTLKAT